LKILELLGFFFLSSVIIVAILAVFPPSLLQLQTGKHLLVTCRSSLRRVPFPRLSMVLFLLEIEFYTSSKKIKLVYHSCSESHPVLLDS